MKEIIIKETQENQRFDKFLKKLLPAAGSSFLYKMLRKKNITLNGKKSEGKEILKAGDKISIFFSDETYAKFSQKKEAPLSEKISLPSSFQVIYEDRDLVIMNKWNGILSQKSGRNDCSMNEYLKCYVENKFPKENFLTFTPGVCNRLDRNTSGLLIGGISLKGSQAVSKALKERTIQKYYTAIVKGVIQKKTYLKGYLIKDEKTNKVTITNTPAAGCVPIETEYIPITTNDEYTYLKIHLITGKTHQIRAHLAFAGHPIIGDTKYGNKRTNEYFQKKFALRYQLLHAKELIFPKNFELEKLQGKTIMAEEPEHFTKIKKSINI